MLEIHLFGGLRVSLDAQPWRLTTLPRTLSLWGYLLLHRERPVARDTITYTLWPAAAETAARANLRRHLHDLRRALPLAPPGTPWVLAKRESLQWNPAAPFWLDVTEFELLSGPEDRLSEAVALYTGDLLPEINEDWAFTERERLRRLYFTDLHRLVTRHRERQEFAQAITLTQQLLAHDPLREDAVRDLIALHYAAGDRAAALQEYDRFKALLASELDVSPMSETVALYEMIRTVAGPDEAVSESAHQSAAASAPAPDAPPSPSPPAPPAGERPSWHLPASLTSLVGREQELDRIGQLLASPTVRLLTLVGPGGAGKTRLAVQAASAAAGQFTDGVAFVNLAPLTTSDLVSSAIADTLGVREAPGQPIVQTLVEHLRARHLLLVLDNFEHLLPAVGLINDLLVACPGIKALVTSRETLRLRGEQVFNVPPLALPDLKRLPPIEALAQAPAVALFVQRSRAVRPDFVLTARNAAATAEIVVRLDGLPLAIELAAARSRYLSPEALLARLTDPTQHAALQLLTGGPRDLPARQQTLRATITWSYSLLQPAEQTLFLRLALFAGSFDLNAAEAVGGSLRGMAAEDCVAALLDKSLLYCVEPTGEPGGARFAMLAVLREFALDLLAQSEDSEAARAAFVSHYRGLAVQAEVGWRSSDQGRWLDWVRAEEDNLRQALELSLSGDADAVLTSHGVTILLGLDRYWRQLARIIDTRRWIERGLAHGERLSLAYQARLLTMAGFYAMLAGVEVANVMGYHEQGLALARRVEDVGLMVDVLEMYGVDAVKAQLDDQAIALVSEAMALERMLSGGMSMRLAVLTNILATIYYNSKQFSRALVLLDEIVPFVRERGTVQQLCAMLNNVSNLARKLGDFERDRICLVEVWQLEQAHGDTMGELHLLSAVAERAHFQGRMELSARLHSAEQALARQLGFAFPPAYQVEFDAYVAELRSRLAPATFDAAWAAGAVLTIEDAIGLGLMEPSPPAPAKPAEPVRPTIRKPAVHMLSEREQEVAAALAQGLTNEEIAGKLYIVVKTVEKHVSSILSKLGFRNRAEIAAWAVAYGLAAGPEDLDAQTRSGQKVGSKR
jgi:non-specific serine/threonine protein kinase